MWRVHHVGRNGAVKDDSNFRIERPFKCAHCNHTSGLPGNLRKHLKNIHPDLPVEYVDLRKQLAEIVNSRDIVPKGGGGGGGGGAAAAAGTEAGEGEEEI